MSPRDHLELNDEQRALLDAFRIEQGPSAATTARIKDRVLASTSSSVVRGPWSRRVPRAAWIGGGVALAAAATILLAVQLSPENAMLVDSTTAQQAADTPESGGAMQTATPAHLPTRPPSAPEPSAPSMKPNPVEKTDTSQRSRPSAKLGPSRLPQRVRLDPPDEPPVAAPPVLSPSSLAAETRLLERARKAVAAGDAQAALVLLREARAKFPDGVLGEERAALHVVALCALGRIEDGQAAADAFVRAHPRSALRTRVERACPPPSE